MSDEFEELAGPAGLNEEDAEAIVEVDDEDVAVVDPAIDPLDVDEEEAEEEVDPDKADMEEVMWQDYDER